MLCQLLTLCLWITWKKHLAHPIIDLFDIEILLFYKEAQFRHVDIRLESHLSHYTQTWELTNLYQQDLRLDSQSETWTIFVISLATWLAFPPSCFRSTRPQMVMMCAAATNLKTTMGGMPAAAVVFDITFYFGQKDFTQGPDKRLTKCIICVSKI